jgi:hypothetical protein
VRAALGARRKGLGDTAQTPQYMATMSRRGYRFLASVTEYTGAARGPAGPATPAALLPPDRYPDQGVAPLLGALPRPETERRLTVLFCHLADSTRLAGHLDPEDSRVIVRASWSTLLYTDQTNNQTIVVEIAPIGFPIPLGRVPQSCG